MPKRNRRSVVGPSVGIIYFVQQKLLIDSTPFADAGRYGDSAIHERGQIEYWAELVKALKVPNTEYEQFPRGRVAYNIKSGKFTLLADRCILRQQDIVRKILTRLHIPHKNAETGADSHYRCYRCLGR